MPSKRSQDMLDMIQAHKKMASDFSNGWLMKVDAPAGAVARLHVRGTTGTAVAGLDMPAVMVTPDKLEIPDAVILHMHGGAYVSGGLLQCRTLISPICAATGARALTFSYRLAPQYPYPAQLEDALRAYRYLTNAGVSPRKIAFVGESAGGNLALALALCLRDAGEEMPAAIALLSPWVDLAQTGESYEALSGVDATLDKDGLLKSAVDFAGSEKGSGTREFLPSTLTLPVFPPTLIHCGTREILLSDSEMLNHAMLRDGVEAQLVRWEGMCHVFQAFGFEESKAANWQIGQFLKKHLMD
jgi:acetyl esterase/lipase